ncbi:MAG: chemotaxis protein CheA [Candidatus Wallbacteria bacterium]|nr:chemotaxis protein CheA [Candidatus Wallbacteria bacterium]
MDVDLSEYIDEYLIELEEQLERLSSCLLSLEKSPKDKDLIKEIFRYTHTIKGSASTMGFEEIAIISHAFEDLLGEARENTISITPPMLESMFRAYDAINAAKENITADVKKPIDSAGMAARLRTHLPGVTPPTVAGQRPHPAPAAAAPAAPQPPAPKPPPGAGLSLELEELLRTERGEVYRFLMEFDPEMEMKSVRAFLVLKKLKEIGTILQSIPSVSDLQSNASPAFTSLEIFIRTETPKDRLEQIGAFGNAKCITVTPSAPPPPQPEAAAPEPPPPPRVEPPPSPPPAPVAAPAPSPPREPEPPPPEPAALAAPPEPPEGPLGPVVDLSLPPRSLLETLTEEQRTLIIESLNQNLNVFEVDILFQDATARSLTRAWQIWQRVADVSRIISSDPKPEGIHKGFKGRLQLLIATEKEIEQLKDMMVAEEVGRSTFTTIAMERMEPVALVEPATHPGELGATVDRSSKEATADTSRIAATQTVRVPVERLNKLMNLVGELVINKTQFVNLFARYMESGDAERLRSGIQELNQSLSTITNELQTGIMKVRMVQIGQVFSRFTRLVRDLSKSLGKRVTLLIEGAETEIDKNVIDEIGDPLMHLVRNSLDHGIEAPDVRRMKGKPEEGFLMLRARHVGENIIVETVDDGSGLDLEKIKKRALERGITDEAKLRAMSVNEIYNFIFYPGFSTAAQVSNVSGRGVGMDVVKDAIQKLRGEITIKSEKDNGTTVQIKLPLTLAIIQGLLVRVAGETFAIPLSSVRETIQLDPGHVHIINSHRVINFRETVIPLIYLQDYFELGEQRSNKSFIVFAEDDDSKIGLVVDSLIGRREIVSKTLDKRFVSVKGVQGATVLGDGTVSLILDVPALVDDAKDRFHQ